MRGKGRPVRTASALLGLGTVGLIPASLSLQQPEAGRPRPAVFRARVAPQAVPALPGVYASYSVASVYVIECGDRYVLVDTGLDRDVEQNLENFRKAGVDLQRISAIFTTHFHYDHISGLARAKQRLGCPVVAHRENVYAIKSGDPTLTARIQPYISGYSFPFPPSQVDIVVEDGDTRPPVRGGFTGWLDVQWGSNYEDLIDSMRRIQQIAPHYCLSSHGRPWRYSPEASEKVIRMAEEKLAEGPSSPVFYTRHSAGVRLREPQRIRLP